MSTPATHNFGWRIGAAFDWIESSPESNNHFWRTQPTTGTSADDYYAETFPDAVPLQSVPARSQITEDERLAKELQDHEYAMQVYSQQQIDSQIVAEEYGQQIGDAGYVTGMYPRNQIVATTQQPKALQDPNVRAQIINQKQHRPWFIWTVSLIQLGTLIASFFINYNITGSYIQTTPVWNYMIGPTSGTLIRMGARFVPCIRVVPDYTTNATTPYLPSCPLGIPAPCTIQSVCGLDGSTNQWYRFIMPIFLHAGVVHLLFNLLFQLRAGADMERDWGSFRVATIYMLSGIAGFVFGANLNYLQPSVGCSGALFGLVACLLLDLFMNWKIIVKPWLQLLKIVLVLAVSFVLGLLPYIDNFAHIGGFFTGLLAGLVLIPGITFSHCQKWTRRVLMVLAFLLLVGEFTALFIFFYNGQDANCSWCKWLDCAFPTLCASTMA
jgi:membrane associated rhomboid family serine protease